MKAVPERCDGWVCVRCVGGAHGKCSEKDCPCDCASVLATRTAEMPGPAAAAEVGPRGTFACPICGFDQPHTHDHRVVEMHRAGSLNDNQRRELRKEAEWEHRFATLRAECESDPRAYVAKYGTINSVESQRLVNWLLSMLDDRRRQLSAMAVETIASAAKLRLAESSTPRPSEDCPACEGEMTEGGGPCFACKGTGKAGHGSGSAPPDYDAVATTVWDDAIRAAQLIAEEDLCWGTAARIRALASPFTPKEET